MQVGISYSDGFGREIQKKVPGRGGRTRPAAPSSWARMGPRPPATPAALGGQRVDRVRQQGQAGPAVRAVLHRHAPLRVRRPDRRQPDAAATTRSGGSSPRCIPSTRGRRCVFDPWRQEHWDVNDTILLVTRATDPMSGDTSPAPPGAELPADLARPAGRWRRLGASEQAAAAARRRCTPARRRSRTSTRWAARSSPSRTTGSSGAGDARSRSVHRNARACSTSRATSARCSTRTDRVVIAIRLRHAGPSRPPREHGRGRALDRSTTSPGSRCTRLGQPRPSSSARRATCCAGPSTTYVREGDAPERLVAARCTVRPARTRRRRTCAAGVPGLRPGRRRHQRAVRFQGKPAAETRRRLAGEYKSTPDWSGDVPLEPETLPTAASLRRAQPPASGDHPGPQRRSDPRTTKPAWWRPSRPTCAAKARRAACGRPSSRTSTTTPRDSESASSTATVPPRRTATIRSHSAQPDATRVGDKRAAGPLLHLRPVGNITRHRGCRSGDGLLPQPVHDRPRSDYHLRRDLSADRGHRSRAHGRVQRDGWARWRATCRSRDD